MFDALRACGAVEVASSEEAPSDHDLGGSGYSVAFDPLDGSSIIGANWAVRACEGGLSDVMGSLRPELPLTRRGDLPALMLPAQSLQPAQPLPCSPATSAPGAGGQYLQHLAGARLCGARGAGAGEGS